MRVGLYLATLVFLALAFLLLRADASVETALAVLIVVILHLPALTTVAMQRQITATSASSLGGYPEIPVPFLPLAAWVLTGWLIGSPGKAIMAGAFSLAAITICYAAVRVSVFASEKTNKLAGHFPGFSSANINQSGARAIYLMRVVIVAASAILAGYATLYGAISLEPLILVAVLSACAAVAIGYLTYRREDQLAKETEKYAGDAVAATLLAQPIRAILHCSGPQKAKQSRALALSDRLVQEGMAFAIVARQQYTQIKLKGAPTPHIWWAPNLLSLDAFAHPQIEAVFYVNDTPGNGHMIRFNDYLHIFVADGNPQGIQDLPRHFERYDLIVAPNSQIKSRWKATSPNLAPRIITVGTALDDADPPNYGSFSNAIAAHQGLKSPKDPAI